ncbi:MAG: hypothetical protein A2W93_14485 [Bacteroidetes bacterium GWF2_43_63]|nr:MAG: hypothetical protein A2W94_01055 [Bacteroidetes bacterium GWE2_42_42]OFY52548.1 MAG: hypothetical protein A2W93_14485 [Bacteroidetes bacterium GWF2_43_63]HBG71456.1 hypothetical protein [Bacteroidales bacterium]HCB60792.1 hypothetical protein [Bacteroidales bacterium]HCY23483.1 hypothetical protein [Bacteroidales bacterium]
MKRKDKQLIDEKRNKKIVGRYKELINMGLNKTSAIGKIENVKEFGSLSSRQITNILKKEGL